MFELERGDPYSLEGRVIVYAENLKPKDEVEQFPCMYAATSPIDIYLFDLDNVDESEIHKIEEAWEEKKKKLRQKAKKEGIEGLVPYVARVMSAQNMEDLFEISGDVIHAGKTPSGDFVMALLESLTRA